MNRTSHVLPALVVALTVSLAGPRAARAQSPPQPVVELPPIEVATGVSLKRAIGNARADRKWMGPDVSVSIGHTISRHISAAVQVETDFAR